MNRLNFLKNTAFGLSGIISMPYLNLGGKPNAKRVRITDVKCIRTTIGLRGVNPLVKIETDAGISGIGECHHDENGYGAQDIVLNVCKPILINQDPFDLEQLVSNMRRHTSSYGGNHSIPINAITGVEIAIWDILGKITGQPVRHILGGGAHRDEVRAYLNAGPSDLLDENSCKEFAKRMKKGGWTAAKVMFIKKSPPDKSFNRLLSNVEVRQNKEGFANLREAVGWNFDFAVHTHWELDFDAALSLSRAVAPSRPWWIEDPLPIAFNEQWVRLTEQSPAPILCGENLFTRTDFRPFIEHAGVNKIEIDVSGAGGLLEAKKIADLAQIHQIPVATHNVAGPIATVASVNFAASVREFLGHEVFIRERGVNGDPDVLGYDRPLVKDGYLQLSDKPGLGIELNEDLVKNYLVEDEEWWD